MWIAALLLSAAFGAIGTDAFDWDEPTALDEYVHYDDGYFQWNILTTYRFDEYQTTIYMLNMTSQKWMDETLTSRPVWYHMMAVAVPDVLRHETAFMWIDGGSNGPDTGPAPPTDDLIALILSVVVNTGSVGSYILQIPNQAMVFTNDPDQISRSEDRITAWTWRTFITTHQNQPEVVLRMPMTKAVKRGFDAVNQLLAQERPGTDINTFIPSGGSKRGWTTWSIAATDRRVIAAVPIVMSLLNFNETFQHHYRNLDGAWSFALYDYWIEDLMMHFHDDIVLQSPGLWDYEDMFRYKERLGLIPKLMISATNDEYFLTTDSHAWWNEMPGPKWIDMVPNERHSLGSSKDQAIGNIIGFMNKVLNDQPMPQLDWIRTDTETGGFIRFYTDVVPDNITVWQAFTWKNETRKDFRQHAGMPPTVHPIVWERVPFQELGFGYYLVEVNTPDVGFTGYFFEVTYIQDNGLPLILTSEAHVTPSAFPGAPCYGAACNGYLT